MFFRSKLTLEQQLRQRVKALKGKTIKEKFLIQLKVTLTKLYEIQQLERINDNAIDQTINRLRDEYEDQTVTTSDEKVLFYLLRASDDVEALLDDMLHQTAMATYRDRLLNIVQFLADFNNKPYSEYVKFYQESSGKLVDQLRSVTKDIQYKVSRLNHEIAKTSDEIINLENLNVQRVDELASLSKASYQFTEIANLISDAHSQIEMLKGSVNLTRKSMTSFNLLARMFDELSLHEDYYHYIKEDGYIRRLIKRLYKHPEELDVMDNMLDLTEALQHIKDEIVEIESMVKPAQKMVFDDPNANYDEDVLKLYQRMSQKNKE
jgi:hypothetical protein